MSIAIYNPNCGCSYCRAIGYSLDRRTEVMQEMAQIDYANEEYKHGLNDGSSNPVLATGTPGAKPVDDKSFQ